MDNKATNEQKSAIHAILHKRGLMAHKADMISGITQGRTESTKELTFAEAAALIQSLNMDKAAAQKDEGKKMRASIVAMAYEMRWIGTQTVVEEKRVIVKDDFTRLDNWMLKFSYLKKKLFDYTYKELPTLVTQFKAVYADHLKK